MRAILIVLLIFSNLYLYILYSQNKNDVSVWKITCEYSGSLLAYREGSGPFYTYQRGGMKEGLTLAGHSCIAVLVAPLEE